LLKDTSTLDGEVWFEFAAVQLLAGDANGYRETCKTMLKAGQAGIMRRYLVARAFTLAADPMVDVALASKLGDEELQRIRDFWSLTEQGALQYRSKRYKETIPLFEASLRARPAPGAAVLNWLWLAMAHHQLGQVKEARTYLDKAAAWLDSLGGQFPKADARAYSLHRHNWLEAHVLRREAEALIQPTGRQSGTEHGVRGAHTPDRLQ
jgi:tetratricopeptide (TPR) repeat protein